MNPDNLVVDCNNLHFFDNLHDFVVVEAASRRLDFEQSRDGSATVEAASRRLDFEQSRDGSSTQEI